MFNFITQYPDRSQDLRERAFGIMTTEMSRAVACELNVDFSTINFVRIHFLEFGSTSNRPLNRRPSVTTVVQDLHPAGSPPWSSETSHPKAAAAVGLHTQKNTVPNCQKASHRCSSASSLSSSKFWPDLQIVVVTNLSRRMLTAKCADLYTGAGSWKHHTSSMHVPVPTDI